MSKIFATNLRIDLNTEAGKRAYAYLKNRDRKRFRSYSEAVVTAVNAYFDREAKMAEDPYLETREKEDAFLQEIRKAVQSGLQASGAAGIGALAALFQGLKPQVPAEADDHSSEESMKVAMDFINSL